MVLYPEQLLRRRRVIAPIEGFERASNLSNLRPGSWSAGYTPPPGLLRDETEDWPALNQGDSRELQISPREGHWLSRIEPDLLFERGQQYRARQASSRTGADYLLDNLFN